MSTVTLVQVGATSLRAELRFHDRVVCRSVSVGCSCVFSFVKVFSQVRVSYTSRGLRPHNSSPLKLSRGVKILNSTGRCARHFVAYETVWYAHRSERCTVQYAVSSAQVTSSCVRACSSCLANLHLDFLKFYLESKSILMFTLF